jgi:RimJ/RimL family protein N-acetyltransferase
VREERPVQLRPVYPVQTARLLLRPLGLGDVDALLAYRSRADVCRYVAFDPLNREAVIDRLAGPWATTALTDEGQSLTLGIDVVETGNLVGEVMLFWRSRDHRGGELGYAVNPDFGGRGYATEAARAVLGLGFDVLGLHRITASIDERNAASAKLARRIGMRQEACFVNNEKLNGEWCTELVFAMLASEWAGNRP